jgi:hypothetical protein
MAKESKGTSRRSARLGKPAFQAALPRKYFPISRESKVDLEKGRPGFISRRFRLISPTKIAEQLCPESDMMGVFRDGMASARGYIERLGPYQSLLILAIPTSLVEPFKLIAVAVAGEGHWITGTFMIIAAYGCSLVFVERLFRIVRPKLLTLPWFARLWNWVLVVRGKVVGLFRPG